MSFAPLYFLLQQEGFIARSCICIGLTEVRNAHPGDKGRYYTAFYQLSIACERMAKLALILDHMASNELMPPGGGAVRAYGHDLGKLYDKPAAVADARHYDFAPAFILTSIGAQMLSSLRIDSDVGWCSCTLSG